MREINVSLAVMPGLRTVKACEAVIKDDGSLLSAIVEPLFGRLSAKHVQLVPQNFGLLDEAVCSMLVCRWPQVQFRLHANVRVLAEHRMADLSGFDLHRDWFEKAAGLSRQINAPAYSAHAGRRSESTMRQMLNNARRAADLFGVGVAVEGHYPTKGNEMLVSNWEEYRELLESDVPFALDLSHINILAAKTRKLERSLILDMLASPNCLEVHVSENDGRGDWHAICREPTWWMDMLDKANPDAVIFTEGNHRAKAAPSRSKQKEAEVA